jgi:hypothetical protein
MEEDMRIGERGFGASGRTNRAALLLAVMAVFVTGLIGPATAPAEAAQVKKCGSVVKMIYRGVFHKAKVLVPTRNVSCAEARRTIWRALVPGGFWGSINGWRCVPKGSYEPFVEKCFKDRPRRVIKGSKPKRCSSCRRNVK